MKRARGENAQKQELEEVRGIKNVFSCKCSTKLPRKRDSLIVQSNFCKIIDAVWTKFYFVIVNPVRDLKEKPLTG